MPTNPYEPPQGERNVHPLIQALAGMGGAILGCRLLWIALSHDSMPMWAQNWYFRQTNAPDYVHRTVAFIVGLGFFVIGSIIFLMALMGHH